MFLNEAILRNTYAYDRHFIDVKNKILLLKTIICFLEFDKCINFFYTSKWNSYVKNYSLSTYSVMLLVGNDL